MKRLLALAAATLAACTLVTGGLRADERACNFCSSAELAHVPCPTGRGSGGSDGGFTYALRSIELGWNAAAWADAGAPGLDQDCSDRPDAGLPVLCRSPVEGEKWARFERFPRGVDNSLAANAWAAVVDGRAIGQDVEESMNAEIAQGKWGMVLQVLDWNGADDDAVDVRLVFSLGIVSGPPKWDGTDTWYAVGHRGDGGEFIDTSFGGGLAYVTGGQLVWDARSTQSAVLRLQNHELDGVGAAEIGLTNLTALGALTPSSVDLTLAGAWTTTASNLYADFLSGRDPLRNCAIRTHFSAFGPGWGGPLAADLPTPPIETKCSPAAQGCDQPCGSVSVGFVLHFVRAQEPVVDAQRALVPPRFQHVDCDGG